MSKTLWILVVGMLLSLCISQNSLAQSASTKAGRGLAGMTCAFLEIPGNMIVESHKWGGGGLFLGLVKGAGKTIPRFWVGVYEFFTCPIEAPVNFMPILQPEYPWDYFDEPSCKTEDTTTKGKDDPNDLHIYWDY